MHFVSNTGGPTICVSFQEYSNSDTQLHKTHSNGRAASKQHAHSEFTRVVPFSISRKTECIAWRLVALHFDQGLINIAQCKGCIPFHNHASSTHLLPPHSPHTRHPSPLHRLVSMPSQSGSVWRVKAAQRHCPNCLLFCRPI